MDRVPVYSKNKANISQVAEIPTCLLIFHNANHETKWSKKKLTQTDDKVFNSL